jgi:hypothetical protein
MRKSSQIGFGAAIGLAIFSASFAGDFSSEPSWYSFWSPATAGISSAIAVLAHPAELADATDRQLLPSKLRRRALLSHVQQKLNRGSEQVDPILP